MFPHRGHTTPHRRVARPPVDDLDFPCRVTLADMLTEDNIAIVSEMDLLTEYSDEERQKKAAALHAETMWNQAMLRAWLVPKPKGAVSQ